MHLWSNMKPSDVDVELLAQVIREAGRPVHVTKSAREFVRARFLTETREVRRYTPSATYAVGDKVRWKGKLGEVKAVADGENPRQGKFVVLTLVFPDGGQVRLAAKPVGEGIQDRGSVSDRKVRAIVREYGLAIRTVIQDAMGKDARFVWFEDAQGDNWCLAEMLPEVQDEDLVKAFQLLQGLLVDGVLPPRPTEDLVKTIWGQSNDGSSEYALKAFALNVALQGCNDTHWMGNGWVLESEWQKLQEREALVGPRQPSKITLPEGVTLDTGDDAEHTAEEIEGEKEPELNPLICRATSDDGLQGVVIMSTSKRITKAWGIFNLPFAIGVEDNFDDEDRGINPYLVNIDGISASLYFKRQPRTLEGVDAGVHYHRDHRLSKDASKTSFSIIWVVFDNRVLEKLGIKTSSALILDTSVTNKNSKFKKAVIQ